MIQRIERPDLTPDNKKELNNIFVDEIITDEEVMEITRKYGPANILFLVKEIDDEEIKFIGVPGTVKMIKEGRIHYYETHLWHLCPPKLASFRLTGIPFEFMDFEGDEDEL